MIFREIMWIEVVFPWFSPIFHVNWDGFPHFSYRFGQPLKLRTTPSCSSFRSSMTWHTQSDRKTTAPGGNRLVNSDGSDGWPLKNRESMDVDVDSHVDDWWSDIFLYILMLMITEFPQIWKLTLNIIWILSQTDWDCICETYWQDLRLDSAYWLTVFTMIHTLSSSVYFFPIGYEIGS